MSRQRDPGDVPRRDFLWKAALGAGAAAAVGTGASPVMGLGTDEPPVPTEGALQDRCEPSYGPVTVRSGDARYAELSVAENRRWVASPEEVHLLGSGDQIAAAVQHAVTHGKRLQVRSGGHCYAPLVYNSDTEVLIDLSVMKRICYDRSRRAWAVEPGAQLGDIYATLYRGYGVTLPGGVCPSVGIGGHAAGGGHGLLSRQFGCVSDHLYAVEMIVVGADRRVRRVVATAEPGDPNRDLWWATTGGGGGNFGIVSRYWFRTPAPAAGLLGVDPASALPVPPSEVLVCKMFAPWATLSRDQFGALVRNVGDFYEANMAPDSPFAALCGLVFLQTPAAGGIPLLTMVDATVPDAAGLLSDYLTTITRGTGISPAAPVRRLPWLVATLDIGTSVPALMTDSSQRSSVKSAYFRRGFTDDQITTLYRNLTRPDYVNPLATVQIGAMAGGRLNALAPSATATAQRQSAFLAFFQTYWTDPGDDDRNVSWLRDLYGEVFATTGGVPVPGDSYEGCAVNVPDLDLLDPVLNRSGTPAHTLYYLDNLPRLRRVKSQWDPTDTFRHGLSIPL